MLEPSGPPNTVPLRSIVSVTSSFGQRNKITTSYMKRLSFFLSTIIICYLMGIPEAIVAQDNPAPTHSDISYGPDERQAFDLWLAKSTEPTPLAIYIHGGGYSGGDKQSIRAKHLNQLLNAGITVAALTIA
jgi:hypothetical protein